MIWILGGTSDADYLSKQLGPHKHLLTLATKEGMSYYKKPNYIYKPMDSKEMENFIKDQNIDLAIDMTHPFAQNVSQNAKDACANTGIKYIRYERASIDYPDQAKVFESYDQALEYLYTYKGSLFVTTGVNMAHRFEEIRGSNRFIYRVLPMVESLKKLQDLDINLKDIVAMLGPFSKELNIQLIKDLEVDGMIMKDSGQKGGTQEKIQACLETSIDLFIIKREGSDNISLEEFSQKILDLI